MTSQNDAKGTYRKVAIATCFGTFLEWYDFLTFASLAVIFGPLFFPSTDPSTALLASLATFGVGMVVRPIGAALFGSIADRIGRRPVFLITISLMGLATIAVGFLPTYSQIGIWAPILLLLLRLMQGLSAGGEIGGGAVYLTEHAGKDSRGFKTSFLQLMGPLGIMASTLQIAVLQFFLSSEEFQQWGWRVPFWLSIALLIIAYKTRMALEETPIFKSLQTDNLLSKNPLKQNLMDPDTRKRMFILFFCISAGGSVLFFCIQVYTSVFLKSALQVPANKVDVLTLIATLTLFPLTVFAGALSDKIGRRPTIITGLIIGAIFIQPAFILLQNIASNTPTNFYLMQLIMVFLAIPLALVIGPQTALLAELFPARTRSSAAALPHNLAAGWIGGLLPLIVSWINQRFDSPLAGLWYPTIFLCISALLALLYLPETRDKDLSN